MSNDMLALVAEWIGVVATVMIISLSPAFKRRPLIFTYPRREGIVALSLFGLVFAGAWLVLSVYPLNLSTPLTGANAVFSSDDLLGRAVFYLVALVPFGLALLIRRQPLLSAGLGQRTLKAALQLSFALMLLAVFLRGKVFNIIHGVSSAEINFLFAALITAFVEEAIFRGYIQLRLVAWWGEIWGWVAASLLFAAWRLPGKILAAGATLPAGTALLTGTALLAVALDLGLNFVFGLILGWIMRKCGNIIAPALYHAIHDWISIL